MWCGRTGVRSSDYQKYLKVLSDSGMGLHSRARTIKAIASKNKRIRSAGDKD